jgi:hypothetical protein
LKGDFEAVCRTIKFVGRSGGRIGGDFEGDLERGLERDLEGESETIWRTNWGRFAARVRDELHGDLESWG